MQHVAHGSNATEPFHAKIHRCLLFPKDGVKRLTQTGQLEKRTNSGAFVCPRSANLRHKGGQV